MARKPMKRVTYTDVAKLAGVGTATVDRVLHERGNVSESVRLKVIEAAKELGLPRILPSAYRRTIRVNVILARVERPLLRRMAVEMARLSQRAEKGLLIHRTHLTEDSPKVVAEAMLKEGYDAVIVDAPDHPLIHDAIRKLNQRECATITLISDVPGSERLAYAGTDHAKAGRSAAYFMGRMIPAEDRPQKIVLLCYNEGFHAHAERIRGFGEQLTAEAPHLQLAEIVRGGDDPLLSEALLKKAFTRHPETVGVYNAGGANRGVIAAIKSGALPAPPLFIGHELTGVTYQCLSDGMMTLTIDQSPELQAQYALEVVMTHFGFEGATRAKPPYVSDVPFVFYGPQNLPNSAPAITAPKLTTETKTR